MSRSPHTDECERSRFGGSFQHSLPHWAGGGIDQWPEMYKLTPEQREAVLRCPHKSHDVVRQMWGMR